MNESNSRYYRTKNLNLASFLLAKTQQLVNIDKSNPKRADFVFVNSPELMDLVESFHYGKECLVDARKFALAIKELKQKIYD